MCVCVRASCCVSSHYSDFLSFELGLSAVLAHGSLKKKQNEKALHKDVHFTLNPKTFEALPNERDGGGATGHPPLQMNSVLCATLHLHV